jgi:hypothetical protein
VTFSENFFQQPKPPVKPDKELTRLWKNKKEVEIEMEEEKKKNKPNKNLAYDRLTSGVF